MGYTDCLSSSVGRGEIEKLLQGNAYKMNKNTAFSNDLKVEEQIKEMGDRDLLEFVARQTSILVGVVNLQDKRISKVEAKDSRIMGIVGGFGTVIGAIIVGTINYFIRN
jgi:hypothetical protein